VSEPHTLWAMQACRRQLNFPLASSGPGMVAELAPLNGTAPAGVRYACDILFCCELTAPPHALRGRRGRGAGRVLSGGGRADRRRRHPCAALLARATIAAAFGTAHIDSSASLSKIHYPLPP
jgi:hypothetical protein